MECGVLEEGDYWSQGLQHRTCRLLIGMSFLLSVALIYSRLHTRTNCLAHIFLSQFSCFQRFCSSLFLSVFPHEERRSSCATVYLINNEDINLPKETEWVSNKEEPPFYSSSSSNFSPLQLDRGEKNCPPFRKQIKYSINWRNFIVFIEVSFYLYHNRCTCSYTVCTHTHTYIHTHSRVEGYKSPHWLLTAGDGSMTE